MQTRASHGEHTGDKANALRISHDTVIGPKKDYYFWNLQQQLLAAQSEADAATDKTSAMQPLQLHNLKNISVIEKYPFTTDCNSGDASPIRMALAGAESIFEQQPSLSNILNVASASSSSSTPDATDTDAIAPFAIGRPLIQMDSAFTVIPVHVNDNHIHCAIYNAGPAPKLWYVVAPNDRPRLRQLLMDMYSADFDGCTNFVQHHSIYLSIDYLLLKKFTFLRVLQFPNEMMVFWPGIHYFGLNLGHNISECVSFVSTNWLSLTSSLHHADVDLHALCADCQLTNANRDEYIQQFTHIEGSILKPKFCVLKLHTMDSLNSCLRCVYSRKCHRRTAWGCGGRCYGKCQNLHFCFSRESNCFYNYHSHKYPQGHFPYFNDSRGVCPICTKRTYTLCKVCNTHFCHNGKRSCFYLYHNRHALA